MTRSSQSVDIDGPPIRTARLRPAVASRIERELSSKPDNKAVS
jgi:hypothetical protein